MISRRMAAPASAAPAVTCPGCRPLAEVLVEPGAEACCLVCLDVMVRKAEPVPHRSARAEMQALARRTALLEGQALALSPVAGSGNTGGMPAGALDGRADAIDDDPDTLRLALAGQARLAELRASGREHGVRWADVVWHAYGRRGEEADRRSSCAEEVATRFGREKEREAWAASQGLDGAAPTYVDLAYGNALLGVATVAYERDAWEPVVPAARPGARARFWRGVHDNWRAVRDALTKK